MDRDTVLVIISILLMVALGAYTTIAGTDPGRLIFSLPLVSILTVFLLFLYLMVKAEKRLTQSLDRRLPQLEYMETRAEVEIETIKLAEAANEFIVATGGRSRNQEYLKVINRKVTTSEMPYWRLIFDERITHEVCEHLCSIVSLSTVMIGQIEDGGYVSMLVVDTGFIIALPMPGYRGLMGIKIPNSASAQRMYKYLMMIFTKAKNITNEEEIKALCEKCAGSY